MSRIGKVPIELPEKVSIAIQGNSIQVVGPEGKLTKTFDPSVEFKQEGKIIVVFPNGNSHLARAMHGTAHAIVKGMVEGVAKHFSKSLELQGVGFKAQLKGKQLDLALGYSHPILYDIPEGINIVVTEGTKIQVSGSDKQVVGQVAADIKHYYPVEPYKGKGVRIIGQFVRRKEGKKTAK